jgi:hypothetical protein
MLGRPSSFDVFLEGSPAVPRTLWANRFVGLPPYREVVALAGVPIDGRGPGVIWVLRTGESGRGNDVLGRLIPGLGALAPGPTEALNLGRLGVGGV